MLKTVTTVSITLPPDDFCCVITLNLQRCKININSGKTVENSLFADAAQRRVLGNISIELEILWKVYR